MSEQQPDFILDPARLAAIHAREQAATPGPWGYISGEDVVFIAHAREDIPYLLAVIAQLQAERDEAQREATALRLRHGTPDNRPG